MLLIMQTELKEVKITNDELVIQCKCGEFVLPVAINSVKYFAQVYHSVNGLCTLSINNRFKEHRCIYA